MARGAEEEAAKVYRRATCRPDKREEKKKGYISTYEMSNEEVSSRWLKKYLLVLSPLSFLGAVECLFLRSGARSLSATQNKTPRSNVFLHRENTLKYLMAAPSSGERENTAPPEESRTEYCTRVFSGKGLWIASRPRVRVHEITIIIIGTGTRSRVLVESIHAPPL